MLAEFFRTATVESVKPYLGRRQLLQQAAGYASDPDVVAFLLESGFDPITDLGPASPPWPHDLGWMEREGPPHFAARHNPNPRVVELIIKAGADVHAIAGPSLDTPLHHAAGSNNAGVVSTLIETGPGTTTVNARISSAFVRSANINGNTPLHRAACNAHAGVIDVLVDAGAKVDQRNASGITPLHHAVLGDCPDSFRALVWRDGGRARTHAVRLGPAAALGELVSRRPPRRVRVVRERPASRRDPGHRHRRPQPGRGVPRPEWRPRVLAGRRSPGAGALPGRQSRDLHQGSRQRRTPARHALSVRHRHRAELDPRTAPG